MRPNGSSVEWRKSHAPAVAVTGLRPKAAARLLSPRSIDSDEPTAVMSTCLSNQGVDARPLPAPSSNTETVLESRPLRFIAESTMDLYLFAIEACFRFGAQFT